MNLYDAIIHIDHKDTEIFNMVFRNAANYLTALSDKTFTLIIVANAGAVTLFTKDHQNLYEIAAPVLKKGVILKLCANALNENQIEPSAVWDEAEIVPAGLVEIVRLQKNGFAYLKP